MQEGKLEVVLVVLVAEEAFGTLLPAVEDNCSEAAVAAVAKSFQQWWKALSRLQEGPAVVDHNTTVGRIAAADNPVQKEEGWVVASELQR